MITEQSRIETKLNIILSAMLTNASVEKYYYIAHCDNRKQAKVLKRLVKKRGYKCGFIMSDPSYWNKETCYFKIKWK